MVLELKTIADVGLVGLPNAGKSTLLSVLTRANPKIANYPFTTLSPNLGVCYTDECSFTVADIPGLIEGAADGAGLGHKFLRHIDRTRLIVHVVDVSAENAAHDYETVNAELYKYNPELKEVPQIIALNKADCATAEQISTFKSRVRGDIYVISGVTHKGLKELTAAISRVLPTLPPPAPIVFEPFEYEEVDPESFEIERDGSGAFVLKGALIERLARTVVLDDRDSFMYFQRRLDTGGVTKAMKKAGIKSGDTVRILDTEFTYEE